MGTGPTGATGVAEVDRSAAVLRELEATADQLLERHLATAREWFPHELVPWGRGRDFDGGDWDPSESPVPPAVRSALFVNLLTEDNLPYYFRTLEAAFGRDGAWGAWVRRWTAEEGRHSIVLRSYLTVTRLVDPAELERARMAQVGGGDTPDFGTPLEALAYAALQELATRISHHNTAKALPDAAGYRILKRVAADENLHHLYYRDLVSAALAVDPSAMVNAIDEVVRRFTMPGAGIVGFAGHARAIAAAGIYDLPTYHDQVLAPTVVRQWKLAGLDGLTGGAEAARARVLGHVERVGRAAARIVERAPRPTPESPAAPPQRPVRARRNPPTPAAAASARACA